MKGFIPRWYRNIVSNPPPNYLLPATSYNWFVGMCAHAWAYAHTHTHVFCTISSLNYQIILWSKGIWSHPVPLSLW